MGMAQLGTVRPLLYGLLHLAQGQLSLCHQLLRVADIHQIGENHRVHGVQRVLGKGQVPPPPDVIQHILHTLSPQCSILWIGKS